MAIYFTTRNDLDREDWPDGSHIEIEDWRNPRTRYCPGFVAAVAAAPGSRDYAFRCYRSMQDHEEGCNVRGCTRFGPVPVEERRFEPKNLDVHYSFAHGRVLRTWERNGYDDSDFYATIWNDEKGRPEEVQYDTTRFGGGGGATVDATDEVKARYADWQAEQARLHREAQEAAIEARRVALLEDSGMDEEPFMRLYGACGRGYIDAAVALLRTRKHNRFRSKFRASLAEQVWTWAHDPAPRFKSPLSARQWGFLDTGAPEPVGIGGGFVNATGQFHGHF